MTGRMFPIQSERGAAPHPILIPWSVAEKAFSVYSAQHGRDQSLERLAERGGFGPSEMDDYLPGWRDECSEIAALKAERDKWLDNFNRSEQFQNGPMKRAEKAELALLEARGEHKAAIERLTVERDRETELRRRAEAFARMDRQALAQTDAECDRYRAALNALADEFDAYLGDGVTLETAPSPLGLARTLLNEYAGSLDSPEPVAAPSQPETPEGGTA